MPSKASHKCCSSDVHYLKIVCRINTVLIMWSLSIAIDVEIMNLDHRRQPKRSFVAKPMEITMNFNSGHPQKIEFHYSNPFCWIDFLHGARMTSVTRKFSTIADPRNWESIFLLRMKWCLVILPITITESCQAVQGCTALTAVSSQHLYGCQLSSRRRCGVTICM